MAFFHSIQAPKLVEPGAKYFFYNTLKNIHSKKTNIREISLNVFYLVIFISVLGTFLIYKYKTKPTQEQIKQGLYEQKTYLLNKMKDLSYKEQQRQNKLITNLPKFESEFLVNTF
jgi:hypothetical protein